MIDRATALKELRQLSHVTGVFSNVTDEAIEEAKNDVPPLSEAVEVAAIKAGESFESVAEGSGKPAGGEADPAIIPKNDPQ